MTLGADLGSLQSSWASGLIHDPFLMKGRGEDKNCTDPLKLQKALGKGNKRLAVTGEHLLRAQRWGFKELLPAEAQPAAKRLSSSAGGQRQREDREGHGASQRGSAGGESRALSRQQKVVWGLRGCDQR